MPSRSTIFRRKQKEEDPEKYAEYLERQRKMGKEYREEEKRQFKEDFLTGAQLEERKRKHEEKKKWLRAYYYKRKAEKSMSRQTRNSATPSTLAAQTPRKRVKDMDPEEYKAHRAMMRRKQRAALSSQKKTAIRAADRKRHNEAYHAARVERLGEIKQKTLGPSNGRMRQLSHNLNHEEFIMACYVDSDSVAKSSVSGPGMSSGKRKKSSYVPDFYKMDHRDRGRAVIISNREFAEDHLGERVGTDVDVENICRLLHQVLGFDQDHTDVYSDATKAEMRDSMVNASREDYSDSDCFIGVILTHGSPDGLVWGTDKEIDLKRLLDPFKGDNCPSLKGKPKIFFIQACQGEELDIGAAIKVEGDASSDDDSECESHDEGVVELRFSTEADFIIAYSCVPGGRSWRDKYRGSWFIEAVCDVISEEYEKEDLVSMLTKVNKRVAYDYENIVLKQMPCFNSMLTRKLFFHTPSTS